MAKLRVAWSKLREGEAGLIRSRGPGKAFTPDEGDHRLVRSSGLCLMCEWEARKGRVGEELAGARTHPATSPVLAGGEAGNQG